MASVTADFMVVVDSTAADSTVFVVVDSAAVITLAATGGTVTADGEAIATGAAVITDTAGAPAFTMATAPTMTIATITTIVATAIATTDVFMIPARFGAGFIFCIAMSSS